MPTHRRAVHRREDAAPPAGEASQETATPTEAQTPASAGPDDIEVVWRRKAPPSTPEGTPAAEPAPAGEETDWYARFLAEQAKADDYLGKWQRTAADVANIRRRHEQERQEYMKQANAGLIADLLPVLDSFDRALATIPPELRETTWVDGILIVERQLRAVLERAGLTPIEAQGKRFDPTEHEALMHDEASDQDEDTVTGEFQRGYKLHDRVLRPAMVKVAKK